MRLKKIVLTHFRCFDRLEMDLHPRLTVIVGKNGAGKTAVLDGIAAGLTPVLRHLSSANQRLSAEGAGIKDTDFRLAEWQDGAGQTRWSAADFAQVEMLTTSGLTWDYWRPSSRGKEPHHRLGETLLAATMGKIADSLRSPDPQWLPVFAYYGAQRGRIDIPERLRASREPLSHPTSALAGALDSHSNFKEMLKWFDLEEASELRANKGQPTEHWTPSPALEAVRAAIKSLLGGAFHNPYFNRDHRFVIEPVAGGAPLQVSQLSQGYQSMLALGMDFARRLAVANPHMQWNADPLYEAMAEVGADDALPATPTVASEVLALCAPAVMLVDEIDLHLHPSWQQRVIGDLMRTFPLTQFIVTTHSPQVLSTVAAESIRVLTQDRTHAQIQVTQPPQQTQGLASADVLAEVMGTDPIPDIPVARELQRYQALIQQNLHTSADGESLRQVLETHFGIDHPTMHECHRMIRLQAFKQKLPLSLGKKPV